MVDIKDNPITLPNIVEKPTESTYEASDTLLEDELMDNLAYSDSDAASMVMNDDDFKDALETLPDAEFPISDEKGLFIEK